MNGYRSTKVLPDEILIQGYLNGKTENFNELYSKYKKQVYGYLHRLLPTQSALVDDIFQQTWIKVVKNLHKYKPQQKFLAWILRISHNLMVDHFRKEKHAQNAVSIDNEEGIEYATSDHAPWHDLDKKELADALEWAISQLAPDLREVFLMRQDNIEFKEIAEIQKTSVNTVLGRMQYALKNLRKLLSEWNRGGG